MGTVDRNLFIKTISYYAIILTFPTELNFAPAFQAPFEIADRFKAIVLRGHINCFSFHIICLSSSKHAFKVRSSTFWIIYVLSPVGMISFPSDLVIVGIRMIVPVVVCIVAFHIGIPIFANMCLISFAVFCVGIVNASGCSDKTMIGRLGWFPFTAKSTAAVLDDPVWC